MPEWYVLSDNPDHLVKEIREVGYAAESVESVEWVPDDATGLWIDWSPGDLHGNDLLALAQTRPALRIIMALHEPLSTLDLDRLISVGIFGIVRQGEDFLHALESTGGIASPAVAFAHAQALFPEPEFVVPDEPNPNIPTPAPRESSRLPPPPTTEIQVRVVGNEPHHRVRFGRSAWRTLSNLVDWALFVAILGLIVWVIGQLVTRHFLPSNNFTQAIVRIAHWEIRTIARIFGGSHHNAKIH